MKTNRTYEVRAGISALLGLGLGMLAMYLLDPDSGRRRRARVRNNLVSVGQNAVDAAQEAAHTIGHRAKDVGAKVSSVLR